jgi:hypothetical protein
MAGMARRGINYKLIDLLVGRGITGIFQVGGKRVWLERSRSEM